MDPLGTDSGPRFDMNRAFREAQGIFGENAGLFAGLALVFGIPGALSELFTQDGGGVTAVVVPLVVASIFGAISEAAITLGALRRVKGGAVGADLLSTALDYYVPVFIALLLGSLAAALGLLLLILPGILVMAFVFFAVPAIIEESLDGVKGLERSMGLSAGFRTEVIMMVFLFIVVWLAVNLTLGYLLAAAPLLAAFANWAAGGVISAFGTVLAVTSYAQLCGLHGTLLKVEVDPNELVG